MSTEVKSTADELSTEDKILRAATDVFVRKGYEGTKTRDIAETAGINIATLHYYYRTKEKLFSVVARHLMKDFGKIFYDAFFQEKPLEDKIRTFVDGYFATLIERPYLAQFCIWESENDPEGYKDIMDFRGYHEIMRTEIDQLVAKGEIRPISAEEFTTALVGMTIYPFVTRNSMCYSGSLDDQAYRERIDRIRRMIPSMIMGYLRSS